MKTKGIDHALIVVKDMDQSVRFLSNFFDTKFEEVPWVRDRFGMRICIGADRQIELMSLVDPAKAANLPMPFRKIAEFAERGGEGPFMVCMGVEDAEKAVADAERKGVRVANILEEKQLLPSIPHFKEIILNEEDLPVKGFYFIAYPGD